MPADFGLHSPLVDLFVHGQLPTDMRLLAARNQVAVEPLEQIALLAHLTDDPDPAIAASARDTWRQLPLAMVDEVLTSPTTPERLRVWMRAQQPVAGDVADSAEGPPRSVEHLPPTINDATDEAAKPLPAGSAGTDAAAGAADTLGATVEGDTAGAAESDDEEVRQLSSLPVPVRIKMAMLGTREQRAVLVRDPNRVVSTAVLSSPKLSETEVENFARMTNVAADVLRIIGTNRAWLRSYAVVSALVRNPRTPPAISLGLVARLQERELKALSVDRNVPEALRITSRKVLLTKESRRG